MRRKFASALDGRVGAIEHEQNERGCGNVVAWEAPEEAADEEMSYWTDDGIGDE